MTLRYVRKIILQVSHKIFLFNELLRTTKDCTSVSGVFDLTFLARLENNIS